MSEQDRATYANACVRNATRGTVRRDRRQRAAACSLEDLRADSGPPVDVAEATVEWEELIAHGIDEHCGRAEIIAALRALSAEDYRILDLAIGRDLTDREIAAELGIKPEAAKKRRLRGLVRLRSALAGSPICGERA